MSSPSSLFIQACDFFDDKARRVSAGSWDAATPCAGWSVRDLVNHVVVEDLWLPPLLDGKRIADVGDVFDGDQLGDDPAGAWSRAYVAARAAASEPDVESRTVDLSTGPDSAGEYLMQMFADHLIHAWDLAAATGSSTDLPEPLVRECATWFADRQELYRSMGVVAEPPAVRDDADEQTRLLAAFGRAAVA